MFRVYFNPLVRFSQNTNNIIPPTKWSADDVGDEVPSYNGVIMRVDRLLEIHLKNTFRVFNKFFIVTDDNITIGPWRIQ